MEDKHSKALVKPQGQGLMITKTQGVYLIRVRDTSVVLSHNKRLGTNMVIIMPSKVWAHGRLMMVWLRLVVATRLHTQFSSSRICISSNKPSCSEESYEWDLIANPIRYVLSIL
jgi:hypothetical protein